jgi:Cu+-exporting ATPase
MEILHDPVCGMDLPENQVFMKEFVMGAVYGFCSAECLEKFNTNSAKYLSEGLTPQASPATASPNQQKIDTAEHQGAASGSHEHLTRDPVCGMTVDERTAPSTDRAGSRYYFCSPECQRTFESVY